MKTKDFLRQYYWLDKNIQDDRERLEHYRSMAEGMNNYSLSKEPKATSQGDKLSHFAAKAADLAMIVDKRLDKLFDLEKEITVAINTVDDQLYNRLLKMRYLRFMRWYDIADDFGYSVQHIYKLHGEALCMIKR